MNDYAIWKPEHDGHAPPNWRDGMPWDCEPFNKDGLMELTGSPSWYESHEYKIPAEALNSPNDDAEERMRDYAIKTLLQEGEDALKGLVRELREYPAEELAKHGITLAPEKDWATDLFVDLLEAWDMPQAARRVRTGNASDDDGAAIELLHARVEQMMAELKEYVVAFGAPWAVQYSRDFGLPEGHLHPRHYDILERCGARLDDFVRAKLEASK